LRKPGLNHFLFIFLFVVPQSNLVAQELFRTPAFPGMRPYNPKRFIFFERLEKPVLLKISEQYVMHAWIGRDSANTAVHARVSRIRGDSLYFNTTGYRFRDIESFNLPGFIQYRRSDSLKWRVSFPPENIYHDRRMYGSYLREIKQQFKKDKVSGRSALIFHNFLKINLTKLANLEIAVDYEHYFPGHWAFEWEIGYQFRAGDPMTDDFFMGMIPFHKYNGVNIIFGPKYYPGKITYLQLVIIYRYLEMDLSRTKFATPGRKYGLQYQYRNDVGGGIRFGILTKLGNSGVIDVYIGGGIKVCMVNQFIYGWYGYDDSQNDFFYYNDDHSAVNNHPTLLEPVVNAGVKIGVGF